MHEEDAEAIVMGKGTEKSNFSRLKRNDHLSDDDDDEEEKRPRFNRD